MNKLKKQKSNELIQQNALKGKSTMKIQSELDLNKPLQKEKSKKRIQSAFPKVKDNKEQLEFKI